MPQEQKQLWDQFHASAQTGLLGFEWPFGVERDHFPPAKVGDGRRQRGDVIGGEAQRRPDEAAAGRRPLTSERTFHVAVHILNRTAARRAAARLMTSAAGGEKPQRSAFEA